VGRGRVSACEALSVGALPLHPKAPENLGSTAGLGAFGSDGESSRHKIEQPSRAINQEFNFVAINGKRSISIRTNNVISVEMRDLLAHSQIHRLRARNVILGPCQKCVRQRMVRLS